MQVKVIEFIKQGKIQSIKARDSHQSLLNLLRDQMRCTGTKEGCAEGDCGACTVVVAQLKDAQDGKQANIEYTAINSCIAPAHSINGKALWTIEDLNTDPLIQTTEAKITDNTTLMLHPVQESMVKCHASQCGFCTPGFVMSLFARYQHQRQNSNFETADIQTTLSGNLCRCTGYQSIEQAALQVDSTQFPSTTSGVVDQSQLHALLQILKDKTNNLDKVEKKAPSQENAYFLPTNLLQLLQLRQQLPQAQLIAGATDVGLWINKRMMRFAQIIDLTQVTELQKIEVYPHHIAIGAGVSLNHTFAALVQQRPQLKAFFDRFAGHPVRNAGTIGGNIGNGSPIGDSMPVLIALGANLVLSRLNGKKIEHREVALDQLYTGYRTNILKPDEIISWIKVPSATGQLMQAYKISKRQEDDISAVCMALEIELDNQIIKKASMGLGGVAATPVRAHQTQDFLVGKEWSLETLQQSSLCLQNEFQPISDMRASSQYRSHVLGTLLQRFWYDHQGQMLCQLSQL